MGNWKEGGAYICLPATTLSLFYMGWNAFIRGVCILETYSTLLWEEEGEGREEEEEACCHIYMPIYTAFLLPLPAMGEEEHALCLLCLYIYLPTLLPAILT